MGVSLVSIHLRFLRWWKYTRLRLHWRSFWHHRCCHFHPQFVCDNKVYTNVWVATWRSQELYWFRCGSSRFLYPITTTHFNITSSDPGPDMTEDEYEAWFVNHLPTLEEFALARNASRADHIPDETGTL